MNISMRKVNAITKFKTISMLKNMNVLISPIMAILMTVIMKSIMPETEVSDGSFFMSSSSYALMFGIFFNVVMGAIMMGSYPLAEEKEKHTLRVLMTSSVNSVEYFIGTTIPSLLIITSVNLLLIPVAGIGFSNINIGVYLLFTVVISLISLIIGFIIGMASKNQMQAGLLGMPAMLIFTLLPMFRIFNSTLEKIGSLIYSGVFAIYIDQALSTKGYQFSVKDSLVVIIWLIVCILLFMYVYKRNGLEQD